MLVKQCWHRFVGDLLSARIATEGVRSLNTLTCKQTTRRRLLTSKFDYFFTFFCAGFLRFDFSTSDRPDRLEVMLSDVKLVKHMVYNFMIDRSEQMSVLQQLM